MNKNSFGKIFSFTTWGESHGESVGVVIDGCPSGIVLGEEDFLPAMNRRSPGNSCFTSSRKESDIVRILSGTFNGKTTGAPIALSISNLHHNTKEYDHVKNIYRPGHASLGYIKKYGVYDYRGGGRSSARETACRVAAGVVANKLLNHYNIHTLAYLASIGDSKKISHLNFFSPSLRDSTYHSPIFCPQKDLERKFCDQLQEIKIRQDSIGGIVGFVTTPIPPGLGEPIYAKLPALLAGAMFSIPGVKGFEIGEGFSSSKYAGSNFTDEIIIADGQPRLKSNHCGGCLGGISVGAPLTGAVAFKPTSSIGKPLNTVSCDNKPTPISFHPMSSRHDPCIAIRAVPVVEAMINLVLADLLLWHRCTQL
ncbi:chorismate synthase [Chlamydiifrater volucris]|uniref:chorismate synthase n=1 Tax=Chlamydiifrater volucris TaxID=2681470 RepID=UPI001BCF7DE6|nr:chorismate synthase [Chlamydiifrater volucris]